MNCKSCGEEVVGAAFCPQCGTKVNPVKETVVEGKPKKSSSRTLLIILLIGGALIFLIFILISALLIYRAYFTGV
jgi:uncharacterized membrane protein YvbJ